MAKSSCLTHRLRCRVVVVRDDYIQLCENNLPAAILLGIIEHATNFQLELIERIRTENEARAKDGLALKEADEWIYRTRDEWLKDAMGLIKLHELKEAFSYLEKREFILRRRHPAHTWNPTLQLKLQIEAVNQAITCGPDATIAAVTGSRTSGNGQPHEEPQATAQYKENTDSVQSPLQILRTSPQTVACGKCRQEVRIHKSAGVLVAPCLTCNIDALLKQPPDVKGDAAKCVGFYRRSYCERFGEEPHVTKGKDFGIIEGLVERYGKQKVQGFIRLYLSSTDEIVRQAGYSIAFFSTRINALIVAANGEAKPRRPEIVT